MKESDYIIKTLKLWCESFEGIHVRYAYDNMTGYHIIEVDPESIRRGNDAYKEAEFDLWVSFMNNYPQADLLICEPTDSNNMSNCLFENTNRKPSYSSILKYIIDNTNHLKDLSILLDIVNSESNEYLNSNIDALALAA